MVRFRQPALFTDLPELIVWTIWPMMLGTAASAALVIGPVVGRLVGGILLAGTVGALIAKFAPRVADLHAFAYRTIQGVGVVARGVGPWPRAWVEDAIERAIVAHVGHDGCTRESLDGYGLLFTPGRIPIPGYGLAGGVTDAGWMQVGIVPSDGTKAISEIITHETARALLTEAGVRTEDQQAIMMAHGTWWVVG